MTYPNHLSEVGALGLPLCLEKTILSAKEMDLHLPTTTASCAKSQPAWAALVWQSPARLQTTGTERWLLKTQPSSSEKPPSHEWNCLGQDVTRRC